MKLYDLFKQLANNELYNLSVSCNGNINEEARERVLLYVNDALSVMHMRIPLIEDDVIIHTVPHITTYHLRKEFALSSESSEPYKYILDSNGEPFKENIIKILKANKTTGEEFVLNDETIPASLWVVKGRSLSVPNPEDGFPIVVTYQASHERIEEYAHEHEVDIPDYLMPALRAYVGYLAFSSLNGVENNAKAQEYLQRYSNLMGLAEDSGTAAQFNIYGNTKLIDRGYV